MQGNRTRGLPGMFAPMYHDLARGKRLASPTAVVLHPGVLRRALGSIAAIPCARRYAMHSAIQSTCCSIETIMLLSTEGLPGPVTVKRFGKPRRQPECRAWSGRPLLAQRHAVPAAQVDASRAPVIASKPVPSTIVSRRAPLSRAQSGLRDLVDRPLRIETSRTLARLYVSK